MRPVRGALLGVLLDRLKARAAGSDWATCQAVGARFGEIAWRLSSRDRRRTLEHLQLAFPEYSVAARLKIGRACFRHHGTSLAELLYCGTRPLSEVLRFTVVDGWEHVEEARGSRPIVVFTAHCGNWELLGGAISARGLPLAAIARGLDEAPLQAALAGVRAHFGIETIVRGNQGASRQILRTLRGSRGLVLLIDQDTKVEGVWAPFFGRPAYTPTAVWSLARRFDAVVLPAFIARRKDGRHGLSIEPPLGIDPVAEVAVSAMNQRTEAQIRRFPEQWVWMHRRWRRQPTAVEIRDSACD